MQNTRPTHPSLGRHGNSENVSRSGTRNRSDSATLQKPAMADASNETPRCTACGSWLAMMAMFLGTPNMSQKARRMNLTSFSSMKSSSSETV